MEPQSGGSPASPSMPSSDSTMLPTPSAELRTSDEPLEEAVLKTDRHSSSSSSSSSSSDASEMERESLFHDVDAAEISSPLVPVPDNDHAAPGDVAEVQVQPELLDDWASWPEQPPRTVDDSLLSNGGTVFTEVELAPEVQTMPNPAEVAAAPAVHNGFDPERIPASVFQAKSSSSSQAEWSVASNESLFSIHGTSQSGELGGLYASSRSPFDYFYDEAMAASGGAEDWKLPTVAEGSESADAHDAAGGHGAKEFAAPGSARSGASVGSAKAKKAFAIRRHESGSDGSSSNFSFAFPILAETSPKKKESGGRGGALYQPLQKECERPPPLPTPMSAFEEMTTEEERRRRTGWCCCCGECCGCCWFACSWSSCCCCCRWRWRWRWCCDCRCSCPSLCRGDWCICF